MFVNDNGKDNSAAVAARAAMEELVTFFLNILGFGLNS